jgi:hypothetical protein
MISTTRQALMFWLASALLALVLAFVLRGQAGADWQSYQRTYLSQTGQTGAVAVRQVTPRLGPDGQPSASASPELCLTCHLGLAEISASHPVETFGCVLCHRGVGLALDREQAHTGLLPNPADLSVAAETCGQNGCHGGYVDPTRNHVEQVTRSLQATYAGSIAMIRYTFGAQPDLAARFGVIGGVDPSPLPHTRPSLAVYQPDQNSLPMEQQFTQNCLSGGCHLTEPPASTGRDAPYFYRATGCAACHVLYNTDGLYTGHDPTIARDEPAHPATHRFTTTIPFSQCNHCHNRGNYSLRTMAFTPRPDLPPAGPAISETMPAEGRRLVEYYQPIGQFTLCEWELDCIDCHTRSEAMGDGHYWANQKEMQYVQCKTCHGTLTEPPATVEITDPNDQALRLARLNGHYPLEVGDTVVVTERGEKFSSVQLRAGQLIQYSKVDGQQYEVPLVTGSNCRQQRDEQESRYCHQCHAYER